MQKKLIALAVAGLISAPAFAQSNVTVYGLVDVYYGSYDVDGKNRQSAIDSSGLMGSRIGFRGTEDLGNGLKGLFTLEYQVAPDQNDGVGAKTTFGGSATRQAFVGLESKDFGTVVAGRLQTAAFQFACAYTPTAGGIFETTGRVGAGITIGCGSPGRADNAVAYVAPTFGGLTLQVNHARLTEQAATGAPVYAGNEATLGDKKDSHATMLGANYVNGPLQVGAVYTKIKLGENTLVTNADNDGADEYGIGASYDFKVAKVFALYQRVKFDDNRAVSAAAPFPAYNLTDDADSKWQVGLTVPVSASGTVMASYAKSSINSVEVAGKDVDDNSKAWSLVYRHNLSKRTALYGGYSRVSNDDYAARGLAAADYLPEYGGKASVVAIGALHSF